MSQGKAFGLYNRRPSRKAPCLIRNTILDVACQSGQRSGRKAAIVI